MKSPKQIAVEKPGVEPFEELEIVRVADKSEDLDVPGRQEFDQMASDKTRAAGHEDFHGLFIV